MELGGRVGGCLGLGFGGGWGVGGWAMSMLVWRATSARFPVKTNQLMGFFMFLLYACTRINRIILYYSCDWCCFDVSFAVLALWGVKIQIDEIFFDFSIFQDFRCLCCHVNVGAVWVYVRGEGGGVRDLSNRGLAYVYTCTCYDSCMLGGGVCENSGRRPVGFLWSEEALSTRV